MKCKVICKFYDKAAEQTRQIGDIFECTSERKAEIEKAEARIKKALIVVSFDKLEDTSGNDGSEQTQNKNEAQDNTEGQNKEKDDKKKDIDDMTLKELHAYADLNKIDLQGKTKKADILEILK